MQPRIPLSDDLSRPFHVREGREQGLGTHRLRGRDLDTPYYGVRRRGATPAHSYAPRLRPGDRFSHDTAAALWGLPLPGNPWEPSVPIHVTATAPRNAPRTKGVTGHRGRDDVAVQRAGLPVSPPGVLFLELATLLTLDDLVVVGDALVLDPAVLDPVDPRPWITLAALQRAASQSSAAGAPSARRALRWVRVGSESPMETRLRLAIIRAGLPEPELNVELLDARGHRVLGRFDLVYQVERVIVEYDGDQHRTSTYQYERDIRRLERARDAGWTVIQVRASGFFRDRDLAIERIRRALSRR